MAGSSASRAQWNIALIKEVLSPCYAKTLLEVSVATGPGQQLYSLFPPNPEVMYGLVRPCPFWPT